jgi:hypothetical protein
VYAFLRCILCISYSATKLKVGNFSISKHRFETLADALQRDPEEIARMVGRTEATEGEMKVFSEGLEQAIYNWRQRAGS